MTQEENEYALAQRLAKAMGLEPKKFAAGAVVCLVASGGNVVGWWGRNDPGSVLRGSKAFSDRVGLCGLLDVGTLWMIKGVCLPAGITKDSSDEELDLTLSAMGF